MDIPGNARDILYSVFISLNREQSDTVQILFSKGSNFMKIYVNENERHFKTPFHAYQFANVRSMETILEDIQNDTIVCDIGQIFDVTFPINEALSKEHTNGMTSPWKTGEVPF